MSTKLKLPDALLDYVVQSVEAQLASGEGWADTRPYNYQSIRALAYLYAGADTPFKGSAAVADAIREVYGAIREHAEPPDNRLTGHLAEAREMLVQAGAADLIPGVDGVLLSGAEHLSERLRSYRYLTHFTSANLGTGTNHVAVYGCSVYRVGAILGRDDYVELARSTWDRLVADQDADGYWAETTGGPTVLYNNLTYCCAGRMARWTEDPAYHRAAQIGALFHRRFSYPDGCDVETIDGRCRYHPTPMMWGGFVHSETPEGRAFVARKLETLFHRSPPHTQGTHGGERIALMCEDHQMWVDGPVGELPLDRPHYVESLRAPGAVRRHGPWFAVLQGMAPLPRPWGGFTIDRTGVFSLWHARTALIVNGSGEPGRNAGQSFRFYPDRPDQTYPIPERARLEMGAPGSADSACLLAEYRGGTVRLTVRFPSDDEARLAVNVAARADFYPVPFTLQLELRDGDRVNGVELGEAPIELSDAELRGAVDAGRFRIAFPGEGARFAWPHDPYNPYDVENKKSPRSMYVSLLTLPVGPQGIQVTFHVPDQHRR